MSDYLLLKWGSIKGYDLNENWDRPEVQAAIEKFNSDDVSPSAMMQKNTDRQKEAICELIDAVRNCEIQNDWDGKRYNKRQAKEYIMNYGKE